MSLASGTKLGHYEILEPLGRGGMGEVYRARDARLDREVAIKVLPEELVDSPTGLARFRLEARAVAALSHPNILAIHDVDLDSVTPFAVMELLEGQTLADALAEGRIPRSKALKIATSIAAGLGAAHSAGILHRDIKPANIFISDDGWIKILDFGLTKTIAGDTRFQTDNPDATELGRARSSDEEASGSSGQRRTPALDAMTLPGTLMGTVRYMSPEQIRGDEVDHRSDIFSLGVVLYEMLSGRAAFARDTAPETMTAILREDVETIDCDPPLPPSLLRLLHHCLEKRPEERFQSVRDLGFDLESHSALSSRHSQAGRASISNRSISSLKIGAMLGIGAILLGLAGARILKPEVEPDPAPVRLRTLTFAGQATNPTASSDGKMIAYSSQLDGKPRIWLKQLDGGSEAPMTDGPDDHPRFSGDGGRVYFSRTTDSMSSIYSTPLVGGNPRKVIEDAIYPAPSPDDRQLAFVRPGNSDTLLVSDIDGHHQRVLETSDPGVRILRPQWSPDGTRLAAALISANNQISVGELVIHELAEGVARRSIPLSGGGSLSGTTWLDDRHLVVAKATSLLGDLADASSPVFRVDVETGEKDLIFWVENIFPQGLSTTGFERLHPDTLLFHTKGSRQTLRISALDGEGLSRDLPLTFGLSRDRQPVFSPDGTRVLFSTRRTGYLDIWELDLGSKDLRQLTDDDAEDWDPAYTPDGSQFLWSSSRTEALEIWIADLDGAHARKVSSDGVDAENPTMTADGQWIVYSTGNPEKIGLWKIRPDGSDATRLRSCTCVIPELSPDGKLVLYSESLVSGNVYVLRAIDIERGERVDFEIFYEVPPDARLRSNLLRARWTPDGEQVVFVAHDDEGNSGIFVQDFNPGEDTTASRRPIAGFDPGYETESMGISPDGKSIVFSAMEVQSVLRSAEGVPLR